MSSAAVGARDDVGTADALHLMQRFIKNYDPACGLGSMTVAYYDTAWVACVNRRIGEQTHYVFPRSVRFLLESQNELGGWTAGSPATVPDSDSIMDELMSTLAGLHALCRFLAEPGQLNCLRDRKDLERRIHMAKERLDCLFTLWRPRDRKRVGIDVLVPAMLDILGGYGLYFDFAQRELLEKDKARKLSRINPEHLYSSAPSTLLHSLEAFFNDDSFQWDSVARHKVGGSFMSSPASTAAYLMRSKSWDSDAEAYLHAMIENGAGDGSGGCPSAFPSTYFETAWILTVLLQSTDLKTQSDSEAVTVSRSIIDQALQDGKGLAGFAAGLQPDLDDSSRCLIAKALLQEQFSVEPLITEFFRADDKPFSTYSQESSPSFTANCNALIALLLDHSHLESHGVYIRAIVSFLCSQWWNSDGSPADKWSVSPYYSMMLASQALVLLLRLWMEQKLSFISTECATRVCATLLQCQTRLLSLANPNGSWGRRGPREETAYAILSLISLLEFPFHHKFKVEIRTAIDSGRKFLRRNPSGIEYLWVEKVLYGSRFISEAYVLASLTEARAETSEDEGSGSFDKLATLLDLDLGAMTRISPLLRAIQSRFGGSQWIVTASCIEGALFLPSISSKRDIVFQRKGFTKDTYLLFIPILWAFSNNTEGFCRKTFMSSQFLFDMMVLSMLNFQVDEYMEATIGPALLETGSRVEEALRARFANRDVVGVNDDSNGSASTRPPAARKMPDGPTAMDSVDVESAHSSLLAPLEAYRDWVISNASFRCTAPSSRDLEPHLNSFLMAHVDQALANARLARSEPPIQPFLEWVRGTAADHTSCPVSFAFALALRGAVATCMEPPVTYAADVFVRALASLCRMQNDMGSIVRDRAEQNLNCVDFPEMQGRGGSEQAKKQLTLLIKYEDDRMEAALQSLGCAEGVEKSGLIPVFRLFRTITVSFGEMYILQDLASRRSDA